METEALKKILEAALLAADEPLSLNQLESMFLEDAQPGHPRLREALAALAEDCAGRAVELREVASGYRLQVRADYQPWISRLWQHRPPRYSRALLETLALIAYRQPVTRGEIEEIRGVAVSTSIMRTLQEREWVRVVGHRDVPGRPALYGTTRTFLDYFNLRSLDGLPTLAEIRDLGEIEPELSLDPAAEEAPQGEPAGEDDGGAEHGADAQDAAGDAPPRHAVPAAVTPGAGDRGRGDEEGEDEDRDVHDREDGEPPAPA